MDSLDELRRAIRDNVHGVSVLEDDQIDDILTLIRKIIREELLGLTDLAIRLNIQASTANMRTSRHRTPEAAGSTSSGRIWLRPDVEDWIRENPKSVRHHDPEHVEAS